LKAVHGLDAETELANILSAEILAEINREIIRTVYFGAVRGAQNNVASAGIFDLDTDSDGRWLVERFKGMFFQIEREANAIAKATRRGKGNIILCSSDVASALAAAEILHYESAYNAALTVDDMGSTFAGTLQGRYKVYIDPYAPTADYQHFVVGFRGNSAVRRRAVLLPVRSASDAPRKTRAASSRRSASRPATASSRTRSRTQLATRTAASCSTRTSTTARCSSRT
jgi:hypothetical protein